MGALEEHKEKIIEWFPHFGDPDHKNWGKIPYYMRRGITYHVLYGTLVGDFLQAVFRNDLKQSVGRADETNQELLPEYVKFLYNYAPTLCWGSEENYKEWRSMLRKLWEKESVDEDSRQASRS